MTPKVAYISSEFALSDDLPTYAGGLGILAADILYQAAESRFPLCGISILYKEGFFQQKVDSEGKQTHFYPQIDPLKAGLEETGETVEVPLPGRILKLKIWRKEVRGQGTGKEGISSLYLLDADIPENSPEDRQITDRLYERVWAPHIFDDLVLGIGSVRAARKLNLPIETWHINDDHGSFNILERLREKLAEGLQLEEAREAVKSQTIFTTHTPVGGAESKFSREELFPVLNTLLSGLNVDFEEIWNLGKREWLLGEATAAGGAPQKAGGVFSLTVFAMRHARAINSVSRKHLDVSRELWKFIGDLPLTYVTNAVYAPRWTAKELKGIDENTPDKQLEEAKLQAKRRAAETLSHLAVDKRRFDPKALVLVWSRRFTEYKQPTLLVSELERLIKILTNREKPVYLLMAGKAHPEDPQGQGFVKKVIDASRDPRLEGHLIYLPNYNLTLAHELLAAADVWVNTPKIGWEASGTSGMKAVFNCGLNASSRDGWWVEGANGANGWALDQPDAEHVYALIENEIVPMYYDQREKWWEMVKEALRSCGTRFNTPRMLEEYSKLYQI
ncbi:MAG: alpha-glucan family phosphorylase [Patescibacteria group bacterium]